MRKLNVPGAFDATKSSFFLSDVSNFNFLQTVLVYGYSVVQLKNNCFFE